MKRLNCKISISTQAGSKYEFTYVHKIEIRRSRGKLVNDCTIQIPKNIRVNNVPIVVGEDRIFKRGDQVEIQLGYFPDLEKQFSGFIDAIEVADTLTIRCMDESFLLKRKVVKSEAFENITLSELLKAVSPIPFEAVDATLGDFRISNATVFQVLTEIKRKYHLPAWIEEGKLYCGLYYQDKDPTPKTFDFNRNIIEDELEWISGDDFSVSATCVSIEADNKKRSVEIGDPDADAKITLFFPGKLTDKELKRQGEEKLKEYKFTGFRGSFSAFGYPSVSEGGKIILKDPKTAEREGVYWIKSVTKKFGVDGYRQIIELDRQSE